MGSIQRKQVFEDVHSAYIADAFLSGNIDLTDTKAFPLTEAAVPCTAYIIFDPAGKLFIGEGIAVGQVIFGVFRGTHRQGEAKGRYGEQGNYCDNFAFIHGNILSTLSKGFILYQIIAIIWWSYTLIQEIAILAQWYGINEITYGEPPAAEAKLR